MTAALAIVVATVAAIVAGVAVMAIRRHRIRLITSFSVPKRREPMKKLVHGLFRGLASLRKRLRRNASKPVPYAETVTVAPAEVAGGTPGADVQHDHLIDMVDKNVKVLPLRQNGHLIWALLAVVVAVICICLVIGLASGSGLVLVRSMSIGGLIVMCLGSLIHWSIVPRNSATAVERFGQRVAQVHEGLVLMLRWESLSTGLDANGHRVLRLVTPEIKNFDLPRDKKIQDVDSVPFTGDLNVKYQVVWTLEGISAALFGFSGDIVEHITQSTISAMADFAGLHKLTTLPSCQVDLEQFTARYFKLLGLSDEEMLVLQRKHAAEREVDEEKPEQGLPSLQWLVDHQVDGFARRYGHRVVRVEYQGVGGDHVDAMAAKRLAEVKADGSRAEADGEADVVRKKGKAGADVVRMSTDAEWYRVTQTGEAEALRRMELAEADALRLYEVMKQMAGTKENLQGITGEARERLIDKAASWLNNLDYNAAVRTSDGSEKAVVFVAKQSAGPDLDDAAHRSVVAQVLNRLIAVGKSTDKPADMSAAVAAAQAGQ